jgi:membrane associated rhomboid family serine protease
VQRAKAVEGPTGTFTVVEMTNRNHMSAFLRRATALFAFVALLWVVQVVNWITGYSLNPTFGLIPRYLSGLDGVIAMPFLHGSLAHLMANTPPLLVMGGLLVATTTQALLPVNAIVIGLGGALVWLFGSSAIQIGASGLVFGWFGFLVTRGFVDRSLITVGAALVVGVVYGSILWGVLLGQPGISWEAHLFGAVAGAAAAVLVRTHVHAPRLSGVDLNRRRTLGVSLVTEALNRSHRLERFDFTGDYSRSIERKTAHSFWSAIRLSIPAVMSNRAFSGASSSTVVASTNLSWKWRRRLRSEGSGRNWP